MSMNKILFFNRSAVHYRMAIYLLMEQKLNVDFYFGDCRPGDIKKIEKGSLNNCKNELKNFVLKEPVYWQIGAISLAFKPYDVYLTPGDIWCISTWIVSLLCRIRGKKVYFWTHGWYGKENYLTKIIKKIFLRIPNGCFLYGEYAKQLMIANGFRDEKLSVIYNSLNYEEQYKLRGKLDNSLTLFNHFGNINQTLLFIGRLTKVKKLELLILAISELKKQGRNFNLVLIGDGEMKAELEQLTLKENINENVWFYGECYDEKELSDIIYNSDLCISPGNVGLTAIHAMSFGTPVITHNNFPYQMPEFEAVLPGKTGDFFEYDNLESLVNTIKRWFDKGHDRSEIRNNCYRIIDEKYNPFKQIEVIKNAINI